MNRNRALVPFLALGLVALSLVVTAARAAQNGPPTPNRGGIVFVGSSIFHRWTTLTADMAPLPVLNLAFDGAGTEEMLGTFESFVRPARPKVIVYYCGSNDVDAGEDPVAIVYRIRQFMNRVSITNPDTHVIFVSINRAPQKRARWTAVDAVNHQVEAYASTNKQLEYVDVNPALFNADGTARTEVYMADQLHLRPPAYEGFTRILKPVLTKTFDQP